MIMMQGDILKFKDDVDAICITTNGIIKSNGQAVMGAGVAKAFSQTYPTISKTLADKLRMNGNVVSFLPVPRVQKAQVLSLPTKNDWRDKSDINLIRQSLIQLVKIADDNNWTHVVLPQPGCSNGGLDWSHDVKPLCQELLDDRFCVINL